MMNGIKYCAAGFKTRAQAEEFRKANGGAIYYQSAGILGELHREASLLSHFDPVAYPYSVNWTEAVENGQPLYGKN